MEFAELKNKTAAELAEILSDVEAELHTLRLKASNKTLKAVHKIRDARKTIAKIRMLLITKQK